MLQCGEFVVACCGEPAKPRDVVGERRGVVRHIVVGIVESD